MYLIQSVYFNSSHVYVVVYVRPLRLNSRLSTLHLTFHCKVLSKSVVIMEPNRESLIFNCNFDNCDYKTLREDNLDRHKRNKHEKIKIECSNCGKMMASTSLKRHLDLTCTKLQSKKKKEFNDSVADEKEDVFKIETTIKFVNGQMHFIQNTTKVGNLNIVLVPRMLSLNGKIRFVCSLWAK